MTGFSEPATKPKPSSGCLSRVTSLGSGISSESVAPHFLGSSYVDVLLMWLKEENWINYVQRKYTLLSDT